MFEFFLIFFVMLGCAAIGIWVGLLHEKRAKGQAEANRYRPLNRSGANPDSSNCEDVPNAEVIGPVASDSEPPCDNEAPAAEKTDNSRLNTTNSPLAQKVNPNFDDELDSEDASAIEEKMRHQDAAFNTLSSHSEEPTPV